MLHSLCEAAFYFCLKIIVSTMKNSSIDFQPVFEGEILFLYVFHIYSNQMKDTFSHWFKQQEVRT